MSSGATSRPEIQIHCRHRLRPGVPCRYGSPRVTDRSVPDGLVGATAGNGGAGLLKSTHTRTLGHIRNVLLTVRSRGNIPVNPITSWRSTVGLMGHCGMSSTLTVVHRRPRAASNGGSAGSTSGISIREFGMPATGAIRTRPSGVAGSKPPMSSFPTLLWLEVTTNSG
jgi:hypothetical protein